MLVWARVQQMCSGAPRTSTTTAETANAQDAQPSALCQTPAARADLPTCITESLPDWDIPGFAVAVVHKDQVVFAQGFGIRQVGRRPRPTYRDMTLFCRYVV